MINRETYLKQFAKQRAKVQKLIEDGRSYAEIARILGVTRQRISKVAAQLKVTK